MDDRGRGQAVGREAVEDVLEVVHGTQVEPEEVAVVAGDPVALGHLGRLARDLGDALQLPRRRA